MSPQGNRPPHPGCGDNFDTENPDDNRRSRNAPELGRYEHGIVNRKVRQMIGQAGLRNQDREDLRGELVSRLLHGLHKYNPERGHRKAFATAIVERSVASLLRAARARKRDRRCVRSLNDTIRTREGDVELADTITQREYDARRGRSPRSPQEHVEIEIDVADATANLPVDERVLVERLREIYADPASTRRDGLAEIARQMGVPRTTLNDLMRRLRKRFAPTGLAKYL
jgi:RNA polymerase sigma factor (sigma-70 family)